MMNEEPQNNSEETKGYTIRMPEDLRKNLKMLAAYLDMSMNEIILNSIKKEIKRCEQDLPEIRNILNR